MRKNSDPFTIPSQAEGSKGEVGRSNYYEVTDNFLVGNFSLWLGRIISKTKTLLYLIFIILIFTALFSRLLYLQSIKGEEYRQLAEGNRLRLEYLPAPRGIVFDQFEAPLVENQPSFNLIVYSLQLKEDEKEKILTLITPYLDDQEKEYLEEAYDTVSYSPMTIVENLDYQAAMKLLIELSGYSGFNIEAGSVRQYLPDNSFAHVLGYTSRISQKEKQTYLNQGYLLTERVGRSGIEKIYQSVLRGEPGKKRTEVDSLGREQKVIAQEDPIAGDNVFLNIDSGLQEQIARVLSQRIPRMGGAVVAIDPRDGKVRALVSWPGFDHNAFAQGMSSEEYSQIINDPLNLLFNRAVSGEYPSGSTIKLIVGSAGLQEGLVNKNTSIYSTGGVWYDKWFFPDWKAGGHGYTNIVKAIAESVNTYFYYLALEEFEGYKGLGLNKMLAYFKSFGLGSLLGIDLDGEASGFLPSPEWKKETKDEIWYPGDTLHLSIGQGDILVTPLQVAVYTSAVANGGTLYRPQIVNKVINAKTSQVQQFNEQILDNHLIAEKHLTTIQEGMRSAVTTGSARGVSAVGIPLAGKTGTAQVGGNKEPHAWFTSYGPYSDAKLVLTVLVENGGDSTDLAVPIARDIWQWYAANR